MAFFRQYIAPLFVVLLFLLALVVVSARIFLPQDMAQPAPIEEMAVLPVESQVPVLPVNLHTLVQGLPDSEG
uniref:Uncharacterized protein n=1 Tax=Cyanothece sp. (strain PCC 7425 / ATCC 29141) TaxID=395961 RepID=B8HYB7_CYAP4